MSSGATTIIGSAVIMISLIIAIPTAGLALLLGLPLGIAIIFMGASSVVIWAVCILVSLFMVYRQEKNNFNQINITMRPEEYFAARSVSNVLEEKMKKQWLFCLIVFFLSSGSAKAGQLAYDILDCTRESECKVIAQAKKDQSPQDVTVTKKSGDGILMLSKSVQIEKGFSIGVSYSKDRTLEGFGMWVGEKNNDKFSWDWFSPSKGAVFKKLQEGGLVRVKTRDEPTYQEITEIKFITDISLRLYERGRDGRLTHRVNIKKGSVLSLP